MNACACGVDNNLKKYRIEYKIRSMDNVMRSQKTHDRLWGLCR